MTYKEVENLVNRVLRQSGIEDIPIPIEEIARLRGLQVRPYDLGKDVSGVLVINKGRGTIGYNLSDPPVRQRFTIAHELGHFELHGKNGELFVDTTKHYSVLFRDQSSSTGEIQSEREANAFAAALLMPEKFLQREISKHNFDLTDENALKLLAHRFNVSTQAMTFRIANLELFSPAKM